MECSPPPGPEFAELTACLGYSPINNPATALVITSTCDTDFGSGETNFYVTPLGACAHTGYYWTVISDAMAIHGDTDAHLSYYYFSGVGYIQCEINTSGP